MVSGHCNSRSLLPSAPHHLNPDSNNCFEHMNVGLDHYSNTSPTFVNPHAPPWTLKPLGLSPTQALLCTFCHTAKPPTFSHIPLPHAPTWTFLHSGTSGAFLGYSQHTPSHSLALSPTPRMSKSIPLFPENKQRATLNIRLHE